ncbi:MAG: glycosyltransferase, partial [Anaerolineae bacterium]|nr:glycosyltransferase [Anaerolineae bacterium]
MSELPTVTVIVLNYNGLEHLGACFASLKEADYPSQTLQLMMVDNASTDGSVEFMREIYPEVQLVMNEDNRGFASGNNVGARKATSEYVIFLNNDMRVDPLFVR